MLAHNVSLFVEEERFGSFERPRRLAGGIGTADIDLKALGADDQQKIFTGGSFDQVRNFGSLHAEILAAM
jgi:hypothetical protein